jgi:uncharacterized protein (TIGR04255 family)
MASLLNALKLPKYEDVVLQNPPLVLAVCQVRFPRAFGLLQSAELRAFQKPIQDAYPVPAVGAEVILEAQSGADAKIKKSRDKLTFSTPDGGWTVSLTEEFLGLETRAYEGFASFRVRLGEALDALLACVEGVKPTRVGLRYINEIRVGETPDWSRVIREELRGPLSTDVMQHASQCLQEIVISTDEQTGLTMRHGLLPGGTTVAGADVPEGEPFYLLDCDVFRTFSMDSLRTIDPSEIVATTSEFNEAAYSLFRWSIQDEYLSQLGVGS